MFISRFYLSFLAFVWKITEASLTMRRHFCNHFEATDEVVIYCRFDTSVVIKIILQHCYLFFETTSFLYSSLDLLLTHK